MRFARITELGSPPSPAQGDAPATGADGGLLLTVEAVALNPVDVAIGSGSFYAGHPPLPYVPGIEAVGTIGDRLVYAQGSGRGIARDGFTAEDVEVSESDLIELPPGADPVMSVALGTAGVAGWLATTARAAVSTEDVVVVLGATGAVGNIAVQAAKLRGARHVVAVGRSRARLEALAAADTVVVLGERFAEEVAAAAGAPTVVIDMLWGTPLASLLPVLAPRARVVNVGASAGGTASLPSAAVRGKQLDVLGYSNFGVAREVFAAGYRELVALAAAGSISLPVREVALDDVAEGWRAAAAGEAKVVVRVGRRG